MHVKKIDMADIFAKFHAWSIGFEWVLVTVCGVTRMVLL
jgi:hypothetical protein